MKTRSAIIIGLLLVALTGLLIERLGLYQDGYDIGYGDGLIVLPSVADIQRRVGTKPDGKLCKMWNVVDANGEPHSKTHVAWDKAYNQQCANVQINNRSMGIEK